VGLITGVLLLPLALVRGVAWVADQIHQEALRQWSDPAAVRAELDRIEQRRQAGEIGDDEAERLEEFVLARLTGWIDG
jgi:Gas vesicle protein G